MKYFNLEEESLEGEVWRVNLVFGNEFFRER